MQKLATAPGSWGGHTQSCSPGSLTAILLLFGRNLRRAPTPPLRMKTPKVGVGLTFGARVPALLVPEGMPCTGSPWPVKGPMPTSFLLLGSALFGS